MAILDLVSKFAHKAEIRESYDEILIGEVVYDMCRRGWPSEQFAGSSDDKQVLHFRSIGDPHFHSVKFRLDRKTGGAVADKIIGAKATFYITAEVKNQFADPDDLLNQWSTDFKNIAKIPLLGQVKVNHELNSILAEKGSLIEIKDYINGPEERKKLHAMINATLEELRGHLAKYKRKTL